MPLHRLFHTPGTWTVEEKKELAKKITDIYVAGGLPAFYVVVLFIPVQPEDFFVGGKNESKFVRITIQHIARQLPFEIQRKRFFARYEAALAPFIKDKGLDWELEVTESDINMWRENGIQPPIPNSKAEKEWVRLNKPVEYTDEENVVA